MISKGNISPANRTFEIGSNFYSKNNSFTIPVDIKIVMAACLSTFMVLSVIGNVCTCIVIIKNKNMKSPTNYYLLNLALSDLIFSIFIPIEIYTIWMPNIFVHKTLIIHFIMFDLMSNCSVLTILAFTIERYLAITRPFFQRTSVLTSRICKIISIIWTLSCTFTLANIYFVSKIERNDYFSWFTTVLNHAHIYYVCILLIVFFALPMTIITVLFVLIVFHLKSSTPVLGTNQSHNMQNKKRAIKMLAAVAASFFICWSPYFAIRVLSLLKDFSYEENKYLWDVCIYTSSINSYMSAAINPILYNLMSTKFRLAFKDLLRIRATNTRKTYKSNERKSVGRFSENIAQSSNS